MIVILASVRRDWNSSLGGERNGQSQPYKLLYLCMQVSMCAQMPVICVGTCSMIWGSQRGTFRVILQTSIVFIYLFVSFWDLVSHWLKLTMMSRLVGQAAWDLPISASPALAMQAYSTVFSLSMASGRVNSGPPACQGSSFLTELSVQPWIIKNY